MIETENVYFLELAARTASLKTAGSAFGTLEGAGPSLYCFIYQPSYADLD
jgi:hypothetical protein